MASRSALLPRAEQIAAGLPPLLVEAERVAATVAQGVHGRRRVGQGETFWQFRAYQPGDPLNRIDWRESAKSDRLYIRETEWEAAQTVFLWRDASPSMNYASAAPLSSKRRRSDILTLALASLLVRGGERIALLGGGPPGHGRAILNRLGALFERGGESASLPPVEPLPRYAHLVLVSDLLSPLADIDALMRRFAGSGVRGHLLQVLDPAEETLPFTGRIRFEGLEREAPFLVNRAETVREAYQERLAHHRDGLSAIASSVGWRFAMHRTDHPPETALLALFMALSARRGR